jgi:CHAT domain-containing protein
MPEIHLITDDDATDELIRLLFKTMPEDAVLPKCGHVALAEIVRVWSTEGEIALLQSKTPALIVLDGSVRKSGRDPACANGEAATEMLREMRKRAAGIPILVVAQPSFANLEFEVLQRWDVGLWRPPALSSVLNFDEVSRKFFEVVRGLNAGPGKRRITVTVGPKSAVYRVFDGHYEYAMDREYKISHQPKELIDDMKEFVPIDDREVSKAWQKKLSRFGRDLYRLLIEDVFGGALMERIRREEHGVELRFHLDVADGNESVEFDDLFLLPFEATNSDTNVDGFFCAAIPMSRRVGRVDRESIDPCFARPLKLLLVVGANGGVSYQPSETTGEPHPVELKFLHNADLVRDYLFDLRDKCNAQREETDREVIVDVLDNVGAQDLEFKWKLQDRLLRNDYDIVHFYGHSAGGPDGTCLFAPSGDCKAYPISIRQVAKWMSDKHEKSRVPAFVFLSSCESVTVRTAREMMKAGVSGVLGFRWPVEEDGAIEFLREFYRSCILLQYSVTESYRRACAEVKAGRMGEPVWASAILIN